MSQTYFTHTTKSALVKEGYVPAATIALKLDGGVFVYGIAICSKYDNYSKKSGREIAEARMNERFGVLEIPAPLRLVSDREACLKQLYNLAASALVHSKKWKRRVTKFNLAQNQNAKVISIDKQPNTH